MDIKKVLHILRNPYDFSKEEIKEARLKAADLIEEAEVDYINLKSWAESKGLDVTTYNN
jgi:hypothetical protein